MRALVLALAVILGAALPAAQTPSPTPAPKPATQRAHVDDLLDAYAAGDYQLLQRTIRTVEQFEAVRAELGKAVDYRWLHARRPVQFAFMMDLAIAGLNLDAKYWLDVVNTATKFMIERPQPPGDNPRDDEFEVAFHKTTLAILESIRRPDFLVKYGTNPLDHRMAASPAGTTTAMLIDPWIELTRGIADDQWTFIEGQPIDQFGPIAIGHFEEAAKFESTRSEALVRKAWILVRMGNVDEALRTIDAVKDEATPDPLVRYWHRLIRGRALERLNRADDAAAAYADALKIIPNAQAPTVAMTALEFRRDRPDEAYIWAQRARLVPNDVLDPWSQYIYGDYRFFKQRLVTLRKMSRE